MIEKSFYITFTKGLPKIKMYSFRILIYRLVLAEVWLDFFSTFMLWVKDEC